MMQVKTQFFTDKELRWIADNAHRFEQQLVIHDGKPLYINAGLVGAENFNSKKVTFTTSGETTNPLGDVTILRKS